MLVKNYLEKVGYSKREIETVSLILSSDREYLDTESVTLYPQQSSEYKKTEFSVGHINHTFIISSLKISEISFDHKGNFLSLPEGTTQAICIYESYLKLDPDILMNLIMYGIKVDTAAHLKRWTTSFSFSDPTDIKEKNIQILLLINVINFIKKNIGKMLIGIFIILVRICF